MDRRVVRGDGRDRGWGRTDVRVGRTSVRMGRTSVRMEADMCPDGGSGCTENKTAKFALKIRTYVRVGRTSVRMG